MENLETFQGFYSLIYLSHLDQILEHCKETTARRHEFWTQTFLFGIRDVIFYGDKKLNVFLITFLSQFDYVLDPERKLAT